MKKKSMVLCLAVCLSLLFSIFAIGCGDSSAGSSNTSVEVKETSVSRCQFKDSDGNRSCTNEATHGQLCDYHFNMLNDTYNSMVQ